MADTDDRYAQLRRAPSVDKIMFYFNKGRKELVMEMTLMLLGAAILSFIPFALGKFTDSIKAKNWQLVDLRSEHLLSVAIIVILLFVAWYILVSIGRDKYIRNVAMNKTRKEIQMKVDSKNVRDTEKQSAGKYVGYITNEQQVLARMMNNDIIIIMEGVFLFTLMIMFMLVTDILLTAVYLVLLPVTYFVIRRVVKPMKRDAKKRQKAFQKMNGYLDDVSSNYRLIKMYGLERDAYDSFIAVDEDLSDYYKRVAFRSSYVSPIGRILENSGYVLTAFIGVSMLMSNMITIGMLLSFISYASVIGKPLTNIADGIGRMRENKISMNNITKFLVSEDDTRHGTLYAEDSDGNISLKDVTLRTEDGVLLLDSVSCDIPYGSKLSVVGASGSGKSVFIDTLVALYKADSGSVMYGGHDVFEYDKNSLRQSVCVIPSRPWIFTNTIMSNIRYANPNVSDDEVIEAAKLIGFHDIVMGMEHGYDTVIGEDIQNTSLGFKQMLSLVRLLLTDPKVVICDDSFCGIDALTMSRIKKAMISYLKDRTVILVSDDLADAQITKRVFFLCNGKITVGTHKELMTDRRYASVLDEDI